MQGIRSPRNLGRPTRNGARAGEPVLRRGGTYHQDYYSRNSLQPYCLFVVRPKLQKFRSKFGAKMRSAR